MRKEGSKAERGKVITFSTQEKSSGAFNVLDDDGRRTNILAGVQGKMQAEAWGI